MTSDPIERLAEAKKHVDPQWRGTEVRRTWPGVVQKGRRRTVRRLVGSAALAGAAVLVLLRLPAHAPAPVARMPAGSLRLHDGSLAMPLDPGTELAAVEDSARAARIDLRRGRSRFEVVHVEGRTFSVRAGDVTVHVLGTIFSVERIADRTGVTVERGRVSVEWPGGASHLEAGESGWFPPLGGPAYASSSIEGAAPASGEGTRPVPPHAKEVPSSRALPAARTLSAAASAEVAPVSPTPSPPATAETAAPVYTPPALATAAPPAIVPQATPAVPEARPAAASAATAPVDSSPPTEGGAARLLAEADAAREQGRLAQAVIVLGRVVDRYAGDPRAALAAFTAARILLTQLGRPAEAAAAFARARALAPDGALAEDALAREVEAWAAAREPARARARADEYLRLFPAGRRVSAVRAAGGID